MKGFPLILAGTFCTAACIANAAGTVKTYSVEAAFAADYVLDWNVAGPADTSRTLKGSAAKGAVTATSSLQSGSLERVMTISSREGDRSPAATLFHAVGSAGPVTVTFGSAVMGVSVRFEGGAGRIAAQDASGNTLAIALAGPTSFAGIRSSVKEIAGVVIEGPDAAYAVGVALKPIAANDVFFVNLLYHDLYDRLPTESELDEKVEALRSGVMTHADLAASMLTSGDFHEQGGYLAKCFLALAQHDPDFQRWSQIYTLMRQGASKDAVLSAFMATPEFGAAYPPTLSKSDFVSRIHQDMIGRQPEAAELEAWTAQLASGGSRADIVDTFLRSPQLEERLAGRVNISLVYLALLRREAGDDTMGRWSAALNGGTPLTDVINSILSSAEYASRF
jgi:hypothetical protein